MEPVQPSIRTVMSPSLLATAPIRRSNVPPSASSSNGGRAASGSPVGSVGNDSAGIGRPGSVGCCMIITSVAC